MEKRVKWQPDGFELEKSTLWSFPQHGDWATHDSQWRGNWSPYIPRNIILRYSNEGDLLLDQFVGGGTTLVEAKLLNRDIIGVDCNADALNCCKRKINFDYPPAQGRVYLHRGDARSLWFQGDESVDLICTHPPYANIIKYSNAIPEDLSLLNIQEFLAAMKTVAAECFRVLKKEKICAILIGDTRQKGLIIPLGFKVLTLFLDAGFTLKEIVIKEQHNCRRTAYWSKKADIHNFLLIAHEYLYILRK